MSNRPTRRPSSSARIAQARATSGGGSSTGWIVGAVGVVIVLALVIAIIATRGGESGPDQSARTIANSGTVVPQGDVVYGKVDVAGAALPEAPKSGADPAVGMAVPEVKGEQFNGRPITIPASGKPKVITFVAHWCPHCQKEVPVIADYLAANGLPTDVDLYGVATSTTDQQGNYPPASWLRKEGWPVPTLVDDQQGAAAQAYGIGGFPYFVVVDGQGKVVARTSGEKTVDEFKAMIESARTGKGL